MEKLNVDAALVRALAQLMDETGLTEIEVGQEDNYIRVGKHQQIVATAPAASAVAPALSAPTSSTGGTPAGAITSPMVGTVYTAPQPGAPNFVEVGQNVKAGDTLLIIEAMKVMNPVKATKAGKVEQVLVSNAQPVEFGEALVVLS